MVCPNCSIKSIKTALAKANNGDKISIKKGTYKEGKIEVNKSVTICREDFPILDGENNSEILFVTADNVTIEGLQIQTVCTSYIEDRAGIRLFGVHHFTIKNNKFINTFFGLYMAKSKHGKIYNNVFID
jgi:nitrous oxidase accessory protein